MRLDSGKGDCMIRRRLETADPRISHIFPLKVIPEVYGYAAGRNTVHDNPACCFPSTR